MKMTSWSSPTRSRVVTERQSSGPAHSNIVPEVDPARDPTHADPNDVGRP
jgi:hypothetical protein